MVTKISAQSHRFSLTSDNIFETINRVVNGNNTGNSVIVPHICGPSSCFDTGFAQSIGQLYPDVKANYDLLGNSFIRSNIGHVQYVPTKINQKYGHKIIFANMIAYDINPKRDSSKRILNYANLVKCMISVNNYIKSSYDKSSDHSAIQIHAPKFGCGFLGGNWGFISDLIDDIWGGYTIYIHQPPLKK
jgi:hypothetical protein